eukprot:379012-Rhodomonas_salina.2
MQRGMRGTERAIPSAERGMRGRGVQGTKRGVWGAERGARTLSGAGQRCAGKEAQSEPWSRGDGVGLGIRGRTIAPGKVEVGGRVNISKKHFFALSIAQSGHALNSTEFSLARSLVRMLACSLVRSFARSHLLDGVCAICVDEGPEHAVRKQRKRQQHRPRLRHLRERANRAVMQLVSDSG